MQMRINIICIKYKNPTFKVFSRTFSDDCDPTPSSGRKPKGQQFIVKRRLDLTSR